MRLVYGISSPARNAPKPRTARLLPVHNDHPPSTLELVIYQNDLARSKSGRCSSTTKRRLPRHQASTWTRMPPAAPLMTTPSLSSLQRQRALSFPRYQPTRCPKLDPTLWPPVGSASLTHLHQQAKRRTRRGLGFRARSTRRTALRAPRREAGGGRANGGRSILRPRGYRRGRAQTSTRS